MTTILIAAITAAMLAAPAVCAAQSDCSELAVPARVEVPAEEAAKQELTLADLLTPGTCWQFDEAAAQVALGRLPPVGGVRVFEGREVRQLLARLDLGRQMPSISSIAASPIAASPISLIPASLIATPLIAMKIPDRIVVKRASEIRSCPEIARFVASALSDADRAKLPSRWQSELNCAGAGDISGQASLKLSQTVWNAALRRWEFRLRCARPADCVPFLVWAGAPKTWLRAGLDRQREPGDLPRSEASYHPRLPEETKPNGEGNPRLVKPGQTATLSWEQRGIRIVLPVTCLDAGELGQFVRVRLKNAPKILRAKVVGEGSLSASL